MRLSPALSVVLLLSMVSAQEGKQMNAQNQAKIPTTLAEAHAELERMLSPQVLAEIDALPSENDMIQYHMSLGLMIRNGWGLWGDSPLAKYMRELGFTQPDYMSSAILSTFWRKRHGRDVNLEELKAVAKKEAEADEKARREKEKHDREAKAAITKMMMGLHVQKREAPVLWIPVERRGVNARFLSPFRRGVFVGAYGQGSSDRPNFPIGFPAEGEIPPIEARDDCYTVPLYFDLTERKIHLIRVPEIQEIRAAVVVGGRAWFAGPTSGKTVLMGIGARDRITMDLPQTDEVPDLGMDGQSLLAVYSKTIFRLTDGRWTLIYSGDRILPSSGLPPQLYGNTVFLRDEGFRESGKRLWWLTLGQQSRLGTPDNDLGAAGREILGAGDASSYCLAKNGDLWACMGDGTLLRRSQDGRYSVAIFHGSTEFREDLLHSVRRDQGLLVSAVAGLSDDTLLLASDAGLYRLMGNEVVQELAFSSDEIKDGGSKVIAHPDLRPNTILVLDDQSYVIGSGTWYGVYLLRKGIDGQWKCLPVEDLRDIVVW